MGPGGGTNSSKYAPVSPPASFGIDGRFFLRCARTGLSLRCAGTDWSEPAFVTVAEKLDAAAAARKARALAGAGGEEEKGRVEAFNGVSSGAVEEQPVALPFAPFEQSLVAVDSVVGNNDALSRALGSKVKYFNLAGRLFVQLPTFYMEFGCIGYEI